tara:strand:- start:4055 stop:4780 length:726 start_codon:yes stop_codon:yes gene_type:complete
MSEIFYEVLMEKQANKQKEEKRSKGRRAATAGAQLYAGKRLLDDGSSKLLGVQRFVHGTSDKNAKSILREGLKSSQGGQAGGSSVGLGSEYYQKRSRGKVHLFEDNLLTRRLASGHANLSQQGGGEEGYIKGILGRGKGKKLYGELDYDTYKKLFEADPDYGLSYARASKAGINANVAADNIHTSRGSLGRIFRSRSKNLPKYLREHTGRALQGAALTAGAGYLGHKAYKNLKSIREDMKD